MAKYIFITGGVVSSLGKGVAAAGCGALLQSRGYSVHARKFDPYLNIDPGTMSPIQHGEVYGQMMVMKQILIWVIMNDFWGQD